MSLESAIHRQAQCGHRTNSFFFGRPFRNNRPVKGGASGHAHDARILVRPRRDRGDRPGARRRQRRRHRSRRAQPAQNPPAPRDPLGNCGRGRGAGEPHRCGSVAARDSGLDVRGRGIAPAAGFWSAMRTIVIADAVMGVDNVLGVAGAAHGSILLVVLGLAISIPIVVYGSTLILRCIERFPALLYAGGAVLAWTAAQMIVGEPFVRELLAGRAASVAAVYGAIVCGVLGLAWLRNRRPARISMEATR